MYSRFGAPWLEGCKGQGAVQPVSSVLYFSPRLSRDAQQEGCSALFPEIAIKQCEGARAPVYLSRGWRKVPWLTQAFVNLLGGGPWGWGFSPQEEDPLWQPHRSLLSLANLPAAGEGFFL